MIIEGAILLLAAQLAGAMQLAPPHAPRELIAGESIAAPATTSITAPITFPSIDQAAREADVALSVVAPGNVEDSRNVEDGPGRPSDGAVHGDAHRESRYGDGTARRNLFSLTGYPAFNAQGPNSAPVRTPQQPGLEPQELAFQPDFLASPTFHETVEPTGTNLYPGSARARERRWRSWLGRRSGSDHGLAYDRVMFAPLFTDTALGVPNAGLRFRYNRGASHPDRLEYLWAQAGKGPGPEPNVDMLDSTFRTELGSQRAVLISELSMRSLDPERAPNTTGFGDMVVGGKTLIMDGTCTKLSSIFLTHLNTGPADRGLGTGHVSLEPGLLAMHQWSERTFLHGEVQYRIPIAGSRGFSGDVLTSSWAISTIWQDSDDYAWMPVLEFQTHSFLFGAQTELDGSTRRVDGNTAFDILPGSRWSLGKSSLGACELGVSGGLRCSDADWFDSRMMFDIRWLR